MHRSRVYPTNGSHAVPFWGLFWLRSEEFTHKGSTMGASGYKARCPFVEILLRCTEAPWGMQEGAVCLKMLVFWFPWENTIYGGHSAAYLSLVRPLTYSPVPSDVQ